MTTENDKKLKKLLDNHIPNTVCAVSWLKSLGISQELQTYYRRSGWLESIGQGALKRPQEKVEWRGGLYALQTQLKKPIHAGGLTALAMQNMAHYLRLGQATVYLFSSSQYSPPAWFCNYDWGLPIEHTKSSFLPDNLGLINYEEKTFTIQISSAERGILECLYLAPQKMDLLEIYHIIEGLGNLRPALLQSLLESCRSIKVKRLFLYLAEKASHQWLDFLDESKINLGKGNRSIVDRHSHYISKYQMSVPQELADE